MPFLAPIGGAILGAGGSILGGLLGSRESKGEKQLAEAVAAREALLQPAGRAAIDYYTALLGGDREKTQALLAPSIQGLTAQYATGAKNLMQSLPPGGVRDLALAQLGGGKVRDIGNLFTTAQPIAAEALANLYSGTQGTSLYGLAQMAQLAQGRQQALGESVGDIGGLIYDIIKGRKDKGTTPPIYMPPTGDIGIHKAPWDLGY